jgi:ubiquinone/menaquinone biosynthesis C-methylase UbiE
MEFSKVNNEILKCLYDSYSFNVIPKIGEIISNDRDSYQYLVESIKKFPSQEEFKKILEVEGFKFIDYENLTFGVVAIHSCIKLKN